MTDAGISALAAGCGQLQSIDLTQYKTATDEGRSELSAGCSQLQSINLSECGNMTDAGMSALGAAEHLSYRLWQRDRCRYISADCGMWSAAEH